jgi:glutathione reductase (NADPH)
VEKSSRRIVGAHLVGHHGEELIHLFALAMRHNISADDLGSEIYAFPTFSADMSSMVPTA